MRFAAATGASRSLGELRRSLDLTALDTDRLATLRAEAEKASVGYELVSWTNPCPDDLVDDFAALYARMSTDAPLGDLDIEPEHWDADRVREREATIEDQGRSQIVTAARVGPDGPLVAFTDVVTTRHDPTNAFQWSTLVRHGAPGPPARGPGQGGQPGAVADRGPAGPPAAHLERRREQLHDRHQRGDGLRVAQRESVWRLDLPRAPRGGADDDRDAVLHRVQADDEAALRALVRPAPRCERADLPGDPEIGWYAGTSASCATRGRAPRCRPSWPTRTATLVGWFALMLSLTENRDTAYLELWCTRHIAAGCRSRLAGRGPGPACSSTAGAG